MLSISPQAKTKKNIETDLIGDKVGRIHMGKQDIKTLQTRKMKGLKRSRGDVGVDEETMVDEDEEPETPLKRKK